MRSSPLRITAGLFAVAALSAVLFVRSAPDHLVEAVKATWRRTTGETGQACFDLWASSLKDPRTAQLLSTRDWGDGMIMVEYRARHEHKAYRTGYFDCLLVNGEVDKFAVVMQRSDETLEDNRRTN